MENSFSPLEPTWSPAAPAPSQVPAVESYDGALDPSGGADFASLMAPAAACSLSATVSLIVSRAELALAGADPKPDVCWPEPRVSLVFS